MTRLIARSLAAVVTAGVLLLGLSFLAGQLIQTHGRDGMLVALSWTLMLLAPLDWIPVVIVIRLVRRAPDVRSLQGQLVRLLFEALAATLIGLVGLNYLLPVLPRSAGFVLLILGLLLISAPPVHWLLETYRRA